MKIKLRVEDTVISATLVDNKTAQDFNKTAQDFNKNHESTNDALKMKQWSLKETLENTGNSARDAWDNGKESVRDAADKAKSEAKKIKLCRMVGTC